MTPAARTTSTLKTTSALFGVWCLGLLGVGIALVGSVFPILTARGTDVVAILRGEESGSRRGVDFGGMKSERTVASDQHGQRGFLAQQFVVRGGCADREGGSRSHCAHRVVIEKAARPAHAQGAIHPGLNVCAVTDDLYFVGKALHERGAELQRMNGSSLVCHQFAEACAARFKRRVQPCRIERTDIGVA